MKWEDKIITHQGAKKNRRLFPLVLVCDEYLLQLIIKS